MVQVIRFLALAALFVSIGAQDALSCDPATPGSCDGEESALVQQSLRSTAMSSDIASLKDRLAKLEAASNSDGFFCRAAWCANKAVCCENHAYGLCGSPGATCCYAPVSGIINLCAPGSECNKHSGHCHAK
mmetsp:Transcript_135042/g.431118  ORF Transcript_135042/g.431118 Transcript_135042/m.431118 type:complete len:131 (-) Transcript_135042:445-837(-)